MSRQTRRHFVHPILSLLYPSPKRKVNLPLDQRLERNIEGTLNLAHSSIWRSSLFFNLDTIPLHTLFHRVFSSI